MGFMVPPSKWEIGHAAPIFAAQKYQAAHEGQLPDTRMWRMLEFRHDLNARRFNFYHPNIGRMIEAQNMKPLVPPIIPPAPPIVPPVFPPTDPGGGGGGTTVDPPPNPQGPNAIPEPSAFVMLAMAVLVAGLGFNRFRRRST
jgi:hypothetical protein